MPINKVVQQSSVHQSFITQRLTSSWQCHGWPNIEGKGDLLECLSLKHMSAQNAKYTVIMSK